MENSHWTNLELILKDKDGNNVCVPVEGEVHIETAPVEPGVVDGSQWFLAGSNREAQDKILMVYYDFEAVRKFVQAAGEAAMSIEVFGKSLARLWRAVYNNVVSCRTTGERRYRRKMARRNGLPWEHIKC